MVSARFPSPRLVKKRRSIAVRSALGLALVLAIQVAGQSPYPQFPSTNNGRNNYPEATSPFDRDSNTPDKKRIKALNVERQKGLVSDAQKLLKLARELNDEVAANTSGTMSNAQLRKADEIGKLAKSVKEKMSFSAGGFPSINSPLTMQPGIQ